MACNVFGKPITNSALEELPEYTCNPTSRADRAIVAYNMKNAEKKDVSARQYVDELRQAWGGDHDVSVRCLIYNATGNTITYVRDYDWDGNIAQAPYQVEIANGQWGGFLHRYRGGGSHGGVVYRIKGENSGDESDWMMYWFNPSSGKNKVHTEVKDAGHFDNNDTWSYVNGYLQDHGRSYTEKGKGYKATACIGQASSCIFEAIITMDSCVN